MSNPIQSCRKAVTDYSLQTSIVRMKLINLIIVVSGLTMHVYASAQMTKQQRSIGLIAALTARGDWNALKPELSKALGNGLTIHEIKEELVHLYAYVGFPKSISGLQVFLTVLEERKSQGLSDEWGRAASPIDQTLSKYERGKQVLEDLTQHPLSETKPGYQQFSPEIDTFLKEHLFADLFERDVLTYQQRELATVSALIALGNVEPMLRSHLNICLIQGYTKVQLEELIASLKPHLSRKAIKSAKEILDELRE